jgi:hypothetical protein
MPGTSAFRLLNVDDFGKFGQSRFPQAAQCSVDDAGAASVAEAADSRIASTLLRRLQKAKYCSGADLAVQQNRLPGTGERLGRASGPWHEEALGHVHALGW